MRRLPWAASGNSLTLAAQRYADSMGGCHTGLSAAFLSKSQPEDSKVALSLRQQQQHPLTSASNDAEEGSGQCPTLAGSSLHPRCPRNLQVLQPGWAAGVAESSGGPWHIQQYRCYAAKVKSVGKAASAPAVAAATPEPTADPYAPPQWKMKRVPRGFSSEPLACVAPPQRALLQQLSPTGAELRSLRQLGWPVGPKQVLGLFHDQLADVSGTNVSVVPFVLDSMYQSAASLAHVVKDYLAEGKGMPQVEQYLLTTIAALPASEIPFEGIKVAIKGRMSGKGGMTSRRLWTWGRTSTSTLSDPVDYAHEAVITRAGYIGIKVWIRYKHSHMDEQQQHRSRSLLSLPQLLSMPAPSTLPSRSSSAWWNTPGPLQPCQHSTHTAFAPSYDPLLATNRQLPQPPRQQQEQQLLAEVMQQ